jgi:5'/3'-nucleotidase
LKILVTNDDGVAARGLWALVRELRRIAEVVVVAPDRDQSGIGTAVTLHHPVRISPLPPEVSRVEAYSVEGTPADTVILALKALLKDSVDMVFSGINEGSNLGNDVLISGTFSAALQGYFYGLPSVAISVAAIKKVRFDVAAKFGALIAQEVAAEKMPPKFLLNINLPNLPLEQIAGLEMTRLGERSYMDNIKAGHDGKRKYYWIVRGKPDWKEVEGTDIWALGQNKISVTPLHSDLSSDIHLKQLGKAYSSLFQNLKRSDEVKRATT